MGGRPLRSTSASLEGLKTTGRQGVWYTMIDGNDGLDVQFIGIEYDHELLAAEMVAERLPKEFVQTTLTGWWTTCLEILPSKERLRGRY